MLDAKLNDCLVSQHLHKFCILTISLGTEGMTILRRIPVCQSYHVYCSRFWNCRLWRNNKYRLCSLCNETNVISFLRCSFIHPWGAAMRKFCVFIFGDILPLARHKCVSPSTNKSQKYQNHYITTLSLKDCQVMSFWSSSHEYSMKGPLPELDFTNKLSLIHPPSQPQNARRPFNLCGLHCCKTKYNNNYFATPLHMTPLACTYLCIRLEWWHHI